MNYSWNWSVLFQSTGVGDSTYLQWVLIGLGWLLVIALVAWYCHGAGEHPRNYAHPAQ